MFVSTLLSPLFPLIQHFGRMFEVTGDDQPEQPADGQPEPKGQHTAQTGDDDQPGSADPGDGQDDDGEEDADDPRSNAARKIGAQGHELKTTDLAVLTLLAESPSKAPKYIAMFKDTNPALAERLSRLVDSKDKNVIERLKDADPVVRDELMKLSTEFQKLSQQTAQDRKTSEKRMFTDWRIVTAPYLDPKSEQGQTPEAKQLRKEFRDALAIFPEESALTERMLDDALAIAKSRVGWQEDPVRKAVDNQAVQMALLRRSPSAPRGGSGSGNRAAPAANARIAGLFGRKTPEQLQKIADAKRKGGFAQ